MKIKDMNEKVSLRFIDFKSELKDNDYDDKIHYDDEQFLILFKLFYLKEYISNNSIIFLPHNSKNTLLKDLDLNSLNIKYRENFNYMDDDINTYGQVDDYYKVCLNVKDKEFCDYINNLTVENCLKICDVLWDCDDVDTNYRVVNYYIQHDLVLSDDKTEYNKMIEFLSFIKNNPIYYNNTSLTLSMLLNSGYPTNSRVNSLNYYDAYTLLAYKYFENIGVNNITQHDFDFMMNVLRYLDSFSVHTNENYITFLLYYLLDNFDITYIVQFFTYFIYSEYLEVYEFMNCTQFLHYLDNYDEYKELPLSWVLELCS